jgi:hypothetical protein
MTMPNRWIFIVTLLGCIVSVGACLPSFPENGSTSQTDGNSQEISSTESNGGSSSASFGQNSSEYSHSAAQSSGHSDHSESVESHRSEETEPSHESSATSSSLSSAETAGISADSSATTPDEGTSGQSVITSETSAGQPPQIESMPATVAIVAVIYTYTPRVNGTPPFTWELVTGPLNMQIDSKTGKLSWNPDESQVGDIEVNIRVSNDFGSVNQKFSLKTGIAPKIAPISTQQALVDTPFSFNPAVIGTPPLAFSKNAGPSSIQVNPTTGEITWTPNKDYLGDNPVALSVSSPFGSHIQSFLINVAIPPKKPQIESTPSLDGVVNLTYTYNPTATGDGHITWQLDAAPTGMVIDNNLGNIVWTPTAEGNFGVILVAVSEYGSSTPQEFTIAVSRLTLSSISPDHGYVTGKQKVSLTGSGFVKKLAPKIFFGENEAKEFTVISSSSLEVTTPPALKIGSVAVSVQYGSEVTASLPDAFLYHYCPVITFNYTNVEIPDAQIAATAIGDLNEDSIPDILATDWVFDGVWPLLGREDGTYEVGAGKSTGKNPTYVIAEDFNNDGHLDIVTANQESSTISIIIGSGDGTFTFWGNFTTDSFPSSLAPADYNHDGTLDLAIPILYKNRLLILFNNGDATFRNGGTYATQAGPIDVKSADFNNDKVPDVAVACGGADRMTIFLNNGNGDFREGMTYPSEVYPYFVGVGDFNLDGDQDVAVLNSGRFKLTNSIPGSIAVFLGNGDGTFTKSGNSIGVEDDARCLNVVDMNGDRLPDLLNTHYHSDYIFIGFGQGDGIFSGGKLKFGKPQLFMSSADLDNDGDMDNLLSFGNEALTILRNMGNKEGACDGF